MKPEDVAALLATLEFFSKWPMANKNSSVKISRLSTGLAAERAYIMLLLEILTRADKKNELLESRLATCETTIELQQQLMRVHGVHYEDTIPTKH